jgi:hypothetical protein
VVEFHCMYCGAVEPRDSRCSKSDDGEHVLRAQVPRAYADLVLATWDDMERDNVRALADKRAEVERKARKQL